MLTAVSYSWKDNVCPSFQLRFIRAYLAEQRRQSSGGDMDQAQMEEDMIIEANRCFGWLVQSFSIDAGSTEALTAVFPIVDMH